MARSADPTRIHAVRVNFQRKIPSEFSSPRQTVLKNSNRCVYQRGGYTHPIWLMMVLREAYELALPLLPTRTSKFSRKDRAVPFPFLSLWESAGCDIVNYTKLYSSDPRL